MGADLTMMNAFISEIQAEPIDSSNIDDMEEVLAKEGHYKTATIEKIFKALPETDLTPDEVRRPRPFPAPGSGSALRSVRPDGHHHEGCRSERLGPDPEGLLQKHD